MSGDRVLVAGIGNIFLGDDGFGVEVVRRLDHTALPEDVDVADFGIRGVHLAYELLDNRYHTLVLVDAVPLGAEPGSIVVLDATSHASADPAAAEAVVVDAHSMSPDTVLTALRGLGGHIDRVLVVGCQPAVLDEQIGLSPAVQAAVGEAARITAEVATAAAGSPSTALSPHLPPQLSIEQLSIEKVPSATGRFVT